ncbi:MAG: OB-fold nucleic acid binding domain-containing protein [bacterium]|nr:OB-fold nucleic acid binding domain-containing protein [bacterium]
MATLKDFRDERLKKLAELKKLGVNPYPADSERTHKTNEVVEEFDKLVGKTVTVVGRIITKRDIGKLAFIVIKDDSGQIQLFLKDGDVAKPDYAKSEIGFENIGLLDSGDFVQASGEVVKTKTGEISVAVKHLRILTKAIRPMPSNRDGFSNKEERLRRRYIDTNMNKDVFDRYVRRSKFWDATREFLKKEGFLEINVPVLEHTTGGADAKPFKTHMDAIDEDFYLRISHELPLKRLIGGGYERVFDIGPRFRNENYSDEHLPEHVAMESYAAYQDMNEAMEFYEALMKDVAEKTWGTLKFKNVNGFDEVDISGKWPIKKYPDLMKERFDVDVFKPDFDQLKKILKENNVKLEGDVNVMRALDSVWKIIRRESAGPYWLIHEPVSISPLAKQDPSDERVTQRFHPVIAGSELGNGFAELNDPVEQLNRFNEQQKMRDSGDEEAQMLDIDFVEMLEFGMPPAAGWGYSERFFWMLEGVTAREGVPFPQLRWEIDQVTRGIYPDVNFDKLRDEE